MRTLGTTSSHDKRGVVSAQLLHTDVSNISTDVGEHLGDFGFQCLLLVATWLVLQETFLGTDDELFASCVRLLDHRVLLAR